MKKDTLGTAPLLVSGTGQKGTNSTAPPASTDVFSDQFSKLMTSADCVKQELQSCESIIQKSSDIFEEKIFKEEVSKMETSTQSVVEQKKIVSEESKLEETIQEFETQVREMELNQQHERTQEFLSNENTFNLFRY